MDYNLGCGEDDRMYFAAYCEEVRADVLLGSSNFVSLRDGPLGVELHYRCHCGQPGVLYPKASKRQASESCD